MLPTKVHIVKAIVLPVVIYGCMSWTITKTECQRIDAFELWYWRRFSRVPWTSRKSNQSILKEIKPMNPKGHQLWIFIGRTVAEAEAPLFWPPDGKSQLLGKDPSAGKEWGQEEKGAKEDEVVGWHHQLDGYESVQTSGNREGQGSLACCSPWCHRARHDLVTEQQVEERLSRWSLEVTLP